MATVQMVGNMVLTDDHPRASRGRPVLLAGDDWYRPSEFVDELTASQHVWAWAKGRKLSPEEHEAAKAFLAQWPEGLQLR